MDAFGSAGSDEGAAGRELVEQLRQQVTAMAERESGLHRQVTVLAERIAGLEATIRRHSATVDPVVVVDAFGIGPRPEAGSGSRPEEPQEQGDQSGAGVSRRGLMRLLGSGAAVGAAAVGASVVTATPAAAAVGNPLMIGANNNGANSVTTFTSGPGYNCSAFAVYNPGTARPVALYGVAGPGSSGLESDASAGVCGNSHDFVGVRGLSSTRAGVYGQSNTSAGVQGFSMFEAGCLGASQNNVGVYGISESGAGVSGVTSSGFGLGGQFEGGRAQIYLVPSRTQGPPTNASHLVGELFMDMTGALYVCKSAGSPGTWKLLG